MQDTVNQRRRRLIGTTAAGLGLLELGLGNLAHAQTSKGSRAGKKAAHHTSFDAINQIDAGTLNIGYVDTGPKDGQPVILLHGWPYDIYAFVDVAPILASQGYRVIVPYLRGYGSTRFLANETPRNGQQAAVAV